MTYVSVPDNSQYWRIPMDSLTIQGTSIPLTAGSSVAVDTGTTLIGGPSDTVRLIYEGIQGARQMTGSYRNYYEYPCTANIDLVLTFGGYSIHVTDKDFNLGRYGSDPAYCTGAVFVQALPSGSPIQWIVGDTALKNTYTVFRASPPAVGFAALPGGQAQAQGQTTVIPSGGALETEDGVLSGPSATGSATSNGTTSSSTGSASRSGSRSGSASATSSASGSSTQTSTASGSQTSAPSAQSVVQETVTAMITAGDVNGAAAQPSTSTARPSSAAGRAVSLGVGRGAGGVLALLTAGLFGGWMLL